MKISVYTELSINVVAIFGTMILMSLVPDHYHGFFGDWQCEGGTHIYDKVTEHYVDTGCMYGPNSNNHGPTMHWGLRHWLWLFGGLTLFAVQIARIVELISKKKKDE